MAVSVCFEHVSKVFGSTRAVDDISLKIEPGELFFLLGPSGCGKTTLLRCLAGFYQPEEGRVQIGDKDVTSLPPHQRDTGMVFQSYALWPHMTVSENIAFGLEMRKLSRTEIDLRVKDVLAMVRMSDKALQKPNQLSGGQQQRVALARALVIHPQCLLLDEPLSNLDAKLRLEMRTEIRRICKESGLTALYVTHDQKEALSIADRLAVIDQGRIRQLGQPREVYERPIDTFVANFIGETNFIKGRVAGFEDGRVRVETVIGEWQGAPPAGDALRVQDHVTLSLRPETISLHHANGERFNSYEGTVHDTVYLGEIAQHQVNLRNGNNQVNLKVFELNPQILARDNEEQARVWVDPADVIVLKA